MPAADEEKTKILRTDLREEVMKLKQENGKDILTGGVSIPSQLVALGLVDEYIFVIHPVVAGEGRRLLDDTVLNDAQELKLIESKIFKSGGIALRYVKE